MLALAFALASASGPGDIGNALLWVGLGSCAVLALGLLLPRAALLALGLAGLAGEYVATAAIAGGPADAWAPLAAVAVFTIAELGYWSVGARWRTRAVPNVTLARAAPLALVGVAAIALTSLVALLTALPIAGGAMLTAAGVAAVAALLALLAALTQRSRAG